MRLIERVWSGSSVADQAGRLLLASLELLYRSVVHIRSNLYDTGVIKARRASIPVLSIGNVTVGGTGKTPVAAWIASRLAVLGQNPAIVLRGYGEDEPLVHSRLNPSIPVIVSADRAAGIARAAERANIVVLDDAFQHRRAARDADMVLVSADAWTGSERLLPAGPFREPLSALRRASIVAITRKSASDDAVFAAEAAVRKAAGPVPIVRLRLSLSDLVSVDPQAVRRPMSIIAGKHIAAVAAVGDPAAFFRQMEDAGARVTRLAYPDHHSFSDADIGEILRISEGCDYIVCTLKDAVKLERLWPAGKSRLWYVSLAVNVEHGEALIDEMLERLGRRENE